MGGGRSIPWRRRLSTKILLPSIALFALFAVFVVVELMTTYTEGMNRGIAERLHEDATLIGKIIRDQENRVALHARFMADMVRLSEQLGGKAIGRSVLIYMLEYLKHEGVETRIYSESRSGDDAYPELVRKGMLGIRATALGLEESPAGPVLSVAGVSPIERESGIREVVVASFRLEEDRLRDLAGKISAAVSLIHDGRIAGSTLDDPACRESLLALADEDLRLRVERGGRPILDLDCAGHRRRVIFCPLQIGYRTAAVCALSVSMADVLGGRARIVRDTLLTAGAVLAVVTLVYTLIVRRITRPLRQLSRLTHRVGDREYDMAIDIRSGDEVGELGRSFNLMIERLAESERKLERLHLAEMERADRLATIGELAAGIAHEIRNPLAGISGAVNLFKDDFAGDDAQREMLDEVLKQIDRMEKLTQDLLAYSRPSAPRLAESDLNEILGRALHLVMMGGESTGISIERDCDPRLPTARVDPDQIQQVILNILINAVQAMPAGGTIAARTSARPRNGGLWVAVEITDEGPGMSEEILRQAPRPFFTTKHRGTGLGLSIVQQIVRGHGGELEIDSTPGHGTTFRVLLPAGSA